MIGFKPQQLARNTPVELDFADKWLATDPAEYVLILFCLLSLYSFLSSYFLLILLFTFR